MLACNDTLRTGWPSPEQVRENAHLAPFGSDDCMTAKTLDLRDLPPAERHPRIHEAFDALDGGEALTLINDHEPKPLFYELKAEVESFDADGYEVERAGEEKFVATLPKK
jgi:uncharacterized protein (DUF2249 family)